MDTGNTTWVLISVALVLLMTPGVAFFYAGLVRVRNVLNTIKMSFIALGLIPIAWLLVGYPLAFGEGSWLIGSLSFGHLLPKGEEGANELVFMSFQMTFAIITPALISGAVVGRMRFRAYMVFIVLWSVAIYAPLAHWVWGPGGWIGELGALDFAGGTVVHISAGVAAVVAALVLGPRMDGSGRNSQQDPHNVPMVMLGAALLWFGWIGFNGGSALAADGTAALAVVNTILGGASAMTAWVLLEQARDNKPTAVGAAIGTVVGLVAITPGAGFVMPLATLIIGPVAAVVSFFGLQLLKRTHLDDTLDVFACHGMGGITGALLTGVFASSATGNNPGGLLEGNAGLLGVQAVGVAAAITFAGLGTWGVLRALGVFMKIRTSSTDECEGIDRAEHAQSAYDLASLLGIEPLRPATKQLATDTGMEVMP